MGANAGSRHTGDTIEFPATEVSAYYAYALSIPISPGTKRLFSLRQNIGGRNGVYGLIGQGYAQNDTDLRSTIGGLGFRTFISDGDEIDIAVDYSGTNPHVWHRIGNRGWM